MSAQPVRRRLAAILAADVAGYSRLMGEDEEGTLGALTAHRTELIEPCIAEHRGRVVKTTGDGLLAEFASVVDAVRCAVAFQKGIVRRNADIPEDCRIVFRIGVNLGDVIVQEDDIYGDGVNVAARLEGLAESGGVVISGSVHEQVRGKLEAEFDDLGPQRVKNIGEPVCAFSLRFTGGSDRMNRRTSAAPPLPDKPSIAVLPFDNISNDPEQEYFADGIAEEIITALSRFHWFFVIARNSSFTYKGRSVDVRQVGRELGVRYVLEGSVRKGGDRLRITAQLVEAGTGNHLWAERYDGALENVFDLQDRIAEGVVGAIEPNIQRAEIERSRRKRPESLNAYDLFLRALPLSMSFAPADNAKLNDLLDLALQMDPNFAAAHGLAAAIMTQRLMWGGLDEAAREAAIEHARTVISLNTDDAFALAAAGHTLSMLAREFDLGRRTLDQAIRLNPNSAIALSASAVLHSMMGNVVKTIKQAQQSLRLNPFDPSRVMPLTAMSRAHFLAGRYDEAVESAMHAIQTNPRFLSAYIVAIASSVRSGRTAQGEELVERLLSTAPNLRWSVFANTMFTRAELQERLAAPLRETKLPE